MRAVRLQHLAVPIRRRTMTTSTSLSTGPLATAGAGAVAGTTADAVRQTTLDMLNDAPKTGPGAPDPWLLKWFKEPETPWLRGFTRVGGLVGAASAVPAVLSDMHDGNSAAEAITREGAGVAAGLWAGAEAGAAIGSIVPGAGTAVGLVVGAAAGAVASYVASKGVEALWDPVSDAVGSVAHSVESVFGFG